MASTLLSNRLLMTTSSQYRLQVYAAAGDDAAPEDRRCRPLVPNGPSRPDVGAELFDFAVGFSRQPLPIGNRFAIVTNAGGPGIMATDAATCRGLELAKLRPETLEAHKAKLPPAANPFDPVGVMGDAPACTVHVMPAGRGSPVALGVAGSDIVPKADVGGVLSNLSTAEEARAGFERITNGVKQTLPSVRLPGVETEALADAGFIPAALEKTP